MNELLLEFLGSILEADKFKAVKIGKDGSSDRIVYFGSADSMQRNLAKGTHRVYDAEKDSYLDKKTSKSKTPNQSAQTPDSEETTSEFIKDSTKVAMQELFDAIKSRDVDVINAVIDKYNLKFSSSGKPIFVNNGKRTDIYKLDKKGGRAAAKDAGKKLQDILTTLGVDVSKLRVGRKSGQQYNPRAAFERSGDDGTTTAIVSTEPREIAVTVEGKPEPVGIRDIVNPETGKPVDVTTDKGRRIAIRILDDQIKHLTESRILEGAFAPGVDNKQFLGNVGELAVLRKVLTAGFPAYLLKSSSGGTDIVLVKNDGTGREIAVFYSAKATKSETAVAGSLGANALRDLHTCVDGKILTVIIDGKSTECPGSTAMSAAMDMHGAMINIGVGRVDCGAPEHGRGKQKAHLESKPIDDDLRTKVKERLSKNTDVCYNHFVNEGLTGASELQNLGQLAGFTGRRFADVLKQTRSNVQSSNDVDVGTVLITPQRVGDVNIVTSDCINTALNNEAQRAEYIDNPDKQLTDLLGLRFSTRCVGESYSRIVNTRHPLDVVKKQPNPKICFQPPTQVYGNQNPNL